MRLSIMLTNAYGAEYIVHDGIRGVFIPEVNGQIAKTKKGNHFFITVHLRSCIGNKKKKSDYIGRISIPNENKDLILASPRLKSKNPTIVWGWNESQYASDNNSPLISNEELEAIIKD